MKKTTTIKTLAAMCCAVLLASSCKDKGSDIELAAASPAKFKALREQALKDITQTETFKAEDPISFVSAKGAKFTLPAGCLRDQQNNVVTGDVTLSFVEIYDRGNMVATNKPVMGKDESGNLLPLVTGGEYNIEFKKGDKVLKSGCLFNVSVPATNTGTVDSQMKLWTGIINEEGNLQWDEVKDAAQGKEAGMRINTDRASYDIWGNVFGWTNVDKFYNDSRPKTQIKVTVPSEYDHHNSSVYLAYDGEPNVLAQLDTYDTEEHFFSEHYGFVPIGMSLHVIFVTESNGSVVYHIRRATIAANATIAIQSSDLSTTTKSNLISMINALN